MLLEFFEFTKEITNEPYGSEQQIDCEYNKWPNEHHRDRENKKQKRVINNDLRGHYQKKKRPSNVCPNHLIRFCLNEIHQSHSTHYILKVRKCLPKYLA